MRILTAAKNSNRRCRPVRLKAAAVGGIFLSSSESGESDNDDEVCQPFQMGTNLPQYAT